MKTYILIFMIIAAWILCATWNPLEAFDYSSPKVVKKYKFQGGYIWVIELSDGKKTRCVVTKILKSGGNGR
jgi:hypothetical protein